MFTLFTWNNPNGSIPLAPFSHSIVLTQLILLFAKICPRSLHSIYRAKSVSQCCLKADDKGSLGPKEKPVSNGLCVLIEERTFRCLEWHHVTESTVCLWNFPNVFSWFYGHSLFDDCVESCTRVTQAKYSHWIKNCFGLNKQVSSRQSQYHQLRKGKNICFWVVCLNHFGV